MQARSRWPHWGSSTPTTAASWIAGRSVSRFSTSSGKTFSPPETIMSSSRPSTNQSPFREMADVAAGEHAVADPLLPPPVYPAKRRPLREKILPHAAWLSHPNARRHRAAGGWKCLGVGPPSPARALRSAGEAMETHATSVDPYRLYSTSPNASSVRRHRSGDSEEPAAKTTFSEEVSYFARTSGPRSRMRCSIVGTRISDVDPMLGDRLQRRLRVETARHHDAVAQRQAEGAGRQPGRVEQRCRDAVGAVARPGNPVEHLGRLQRVDLVARRTLWCSGGAAGQQHQTARLRRCGQRRGRPARRSARRAGRRRSAACPTAARSRSSRIRRRRECS